MRPSPSGPTSPAPHTAGSLRDRLRGGPPLLLDGGLGTELIARGLAVGEPPEPWLLSRRADVVAVHRAYVEAGSEAIHTNTFGGTPIRLGAFGHAAQCEALNAAAVEAAREAGPRWVVGDIGPTGERLPPEAARAPDAWRDAFAAQASALARAGADALHVESMWDLREALAALEAAREAAPELPVWVSFGVIGEPGAFKTPAGDPLAVALRAVVDAGAEAVGANCSPTSRAAAALCREALALVEGPLALQPSAGLPRSTPAGFVYDQAPEAFADDMAAAAAAGARLVGGCCGTDPRFIAALRARLG